MVTKKSRSTIVNNAIEETEQALEKIVSSEVMGGEYLEKKKLPIKSLPDAGHMLVAVRQLLDARDKQRLELTKPIREWVSKTNARYKTEDKKLAEVEDKLQSLMKKALDERKGVETRKLEAHIQAAKDEGNEQFAIDLQQQALVHKVDVDLGPVLQAQSIKAKITNLRAFLVQIIEGNVPLSLVKIDQRALDKWAKLYMGEVAGGKSVEGVELFTDVTLRRKTGSGGK